MLKKELYLCRLKLFRFQMAKLHELLAVHQDLSTQLNKVVEDTAKHLSKDNGNKYVGHSQTYFPLSGSDAQNIDPFVDDEKQVEATVQSQLDYVAKICGNALDVELSKEETNSTPEACAELKVGDVSFGMLQATALLALINNLVKVRRVYEAIPTLDATKLWLPSAVKAHIFEAHLPQKLKIEASPEWTVVVEASPEHPAQTKEVKANKTVGRWEKTIYSGGISAIAKADMLARIETLLHAAKAAKARANEAPVKQVKIAEKIYRFINGF